ncbi:MAG: hypothetical protein ABI645_01680 [Pseudomonadota bacterium]
MPTRKKDDQRAGPRPEEMDTGESISDGQPMPEDSVESEGEKLARETERGPDRALNRIPAG